MCGLEFIQFHFFCLRILIILFFGCQYKNNLTIPWILFNYLFNSSPYFIIFFFFLYISLYNNLKFKIFYLNHTPKKKFTLIFIHGATHQKKEKTDSRMCFSFSMRGFSFSHNFQFINSHFVYHCQL